VSVPDWLVGPWERVALARDGEPVAGPGRTVWLEAGVAYVDVRGPGDDAPATGFAGRCEWRDARCRWIHDLDLDVDGARRLDAGELVRAGDELLERGEDLDGVPGPYEERWRRLPGPPSPVAVLRAEGGLAVRVGDHAAAVLDDRPLGGGIVARYQRRVGERWVDEIVVGDGPLARLPAPEDPAGWRSAPGWATVPG